MFLTLEVLAMIITGSAAIMSNVSSSLSLPYAVKFVFSLLFCHRNCEGSSFSIILWCLGSLFCYSPYWGSFIHCHGFFSFLWCCSSNSRSSITGISKKPGFDFMITNNEMFIDCTMNTHNYFLITILNISLIKYHVLKKETVMLNLTPEIRESLLKQLTPLYEATILIGRTTIVILGSCRT